MDGKRKQFACVDAKAFYASVECVDRGLDPLTTNLVVADESRSDGTICLAVSPSLKALGVPGRGTSGRCRKSPRKPPGIGPSWAWR